MSRPLIALALVLAGCALYSLIRGPLAPAGLHGDSTARIWPMVIAVAPPVVFLLIAARGLHGLWRLVLSAGVVSAAVCAVWLGHADHSLRMIRLAYLTDHIVANLTFAHWFGRTLRPGVVPFCTQVARRVHGQLSRRVSRYTRQVTIAWTGVFLTIAATSMLVYAAEPFETWLHFVWWAAAPLTAGVFAVEYAVRCLMIPAHERTAAIDMFRAIATMYRPAAHVEEPVRPGAHGRLRANAAATQPASARIASRIRSS